MLLLAAWSGPWTCSTYTLPDGGTTSINPTPGGSPGGSGGGAGGAQSSSSPATYAPDAGNLQLGLAPGPDGGVTIGPGASFKSDFVYMSNSADGTISRVLIPGDGGSEPYEQARYYCIVPVDNHGQNMAQAWQSAGADQLNPAPSTGGANSPSRTLTDRLGDVWVALRAPGLQAGVTRIINVTDHLDQCAVRCPNRSGLAAGQPFTEGVPLTTVGGGSVTLTPPTLIAPGTSYAKAYPCPGVDPTDETNPKNYDDCITFSIPLGDPTPDPGADPARLTAGSSFARAAAVSPECDPITLDCDVWVGMWNGATWVHLTNAEDAQGVRYDVGKVLQTNVNPYGAVVDCAGVIWGTPVCSGVLSATTTVPYKDPTTGYVIPADTVLTNLPGQSGIPNSSNCGAYGIGDDVKGRIWIGSWCGDSAKTWACSFDGRIFENDYVRLQNHTLSQAQLLVDAQLAWKSYDLSGAFAGGGPYWTRGVNTDRFNNVYGGVWGSWTNGFSFNPDATPSAGHPAVPCYQPNSGVASCASPGTLNWTFSENLGYGCSAVGVDLDAEDNPWYGNFCGGAAIRVDRTSGTILKQVPVGNGVYSYSDFTGYALRHITLNKATYTQAFTGGGGSPELTIWNTLGYTVSAPPGTEIEIEVRVSDSSDPNVVSQQPAHVVCPSVQAGCANPLDLSSYNLQGAYLYASFIMTPKVCDVNGTAPVVYGASATSTTPGN